MSEIPFQSAVTLAKAIQTGQLLSEDVVKAIYQHIERYNPKVNAVVELLDKEKALAMARARDEQVKRGESVGPLHGMPITVKESFDVDGMVSVNGTSALVNNRVSTDAALVKRLKEAGAIMIGKTNAPFTLMDWQSNNKWYGQTNNPHHLDHVPGGSSGGSAAALASGFSPLEIGSDVGGSIRVPAHFCGVCGLRPTEGALPSRGHAAIPKGGHGMVPEMPRIGRLMTVVGPLARSVEDLLFLTEVLWGKEMEYGEVAPVPFTSSGWEESQGLKIAYSTIMGGRELDEEYLSIYRGFLDKLSDFEPKEAQPEFDNDKLIELWGQIMGYDMQASLPPIPFVKWMWYFFVSMRWKDKKWARGNRLGIGNSAKKHAFVLEEKDLVRDTFISFFKEWDIWLTPVAAIPAYQHMRVGTPHVINGKKVPYTEALTPYNFTTTVPGHPVVVIPIGRTSKGLPVGVQIHGGPWQDRKILQIAKYLEQFTEGFQKPELFAS